MFKCDGKKLECKDLDQFQFCGEGIYSCRFYDSSKEEGFECTLKKEEIL